MPRTFESSRKVTLPVAVPAVLVTSDSNTIDCPALDDFLAFLQGGHCHQIMRNGSQTRLIRLVAFAFSPKVFDTRVSRSEIEMMSGDFNLLNSLDVFPNGWPAILF